MKKVVSILLPIIAVALVLVGCGKSSTIGEKKTVSEVDQLLTKKGQTFYVNDIAYKITVISANKLQAKSTVNSKGNTILIKKAGHTNDQKYNIYDIESNGDGSYEFLNNEKAIIFLRTIHGNKYLTIFGEKDKDLKKTVKLTSSNINIFLQENKNLTSNTDFKIENN